MLLAVAALASVLRLQALLAVLFSEHALWVLVPVLLREWEGPFGYNTSPASSPSPTPNPTLSFPFPSPCSLLAQHLAPRAEPPLGGSPSGTSPPVMALREGCTGEEESSWKLPSLGMLSPAFPKIVSEDHLLRCRVGVPGDGLLWRPPVAAPGVASVALSGLAAGVPGDGLLAYPAPALPEPRLGVPMPNPTPHTRATKAPFPASAPYCFVETMHLLRACAVLGRPYAVLQFQGSSDS